jgi:hypothetical protein
MANNYISKRHTRNNATSDDRLQRIFVQIPAYKDSQLVTTVKSMLSMAQCPDSLDVHICWQHERNEILPGWLLKREGVRVIDVDFKESKGVGWARSLLQKGWNGQPYSLLVDSHTRFQRNWDKELIKLFSQLTRRGIRKPIISCLPPAFYSPQSYPRMRDTHPTKIYPKEYLSNMLLRFYGLPLPLFRWLREPIPAQFIAMGFFFTAGSFNIDVPYDPFLYFFGDDITTAARAYTQGYDFYHPHRVLAWHLYDRATRRPHWEDHPDWNKLNEKSFARVERVLSGQTWDEYSTFGSARTLGDYEHYTGHKFFQYANNR